MMLLQPGSEAWAVLAARGRSIETEIRGFNENLKVEPAEIRRQWLRHQWDQLEQTDQQIDLPYRGTEPRSVARQLIDPGHIVDVTGAGRPWGKLPARSDGFEQLLQRLQDAAAVDRLEEWVHSTTHEHDLVELHEEAGPLGPLYAIGSQGRRRAMLAKVLQLPVLEVLLTTRPLPSPNHPIRWPAAYMPADDWTTRHYRLLVKEGLVTVRQEQTPTGGQIVITPLVEVDAAWTFDPPRSLETITAKYRRHYPGFDTLTFDTLRFAALSRQRPKILSGKKARWSDRQLGGKRAG